MNFGPLVPQEIEGMVKFLEENEIPFEIHFNHQEAKQELEPSPANNILYSELRTKAYLAQHFYVEVPDEFIANNPKVEGKILRFITKDNYEEHPHEEETLSSTSDNEDDKILQDRNNRIKWIQRAFAIIFLLSMLYGIISSLNR